MKKLVYILTFLFMIGLASAINSIVCVPTTVLSGGSITCEVDLDSGTTEKNQPQNMTFYNDTAQSVIITSCIFSGTTENSPNPINIINTCDIPSDWGASTTSVVNFSLTSLGTSISFPFNISATTSSDLIINSFVFESPILLGEITGMRWIVSKANDGKAILGADCSGDILQLISGNLIPIVGSTNGILPIKSKYLGYALTSFIPTPLMLKEGTTYIVEVKCDCVPGNTGCMNEDNDVVVNRTSNTGLSGIGTTSFTMATWLTVNTVTSTPLSGASNFSSSDILNVCANVTNPTNRNRLDILINYNYRCDSGSNSSTDRVLIGEHMETRGIDPNTTQMQCYNFIIPKKDVIELGATNCYGATDVSVVSEEGIILITYHSISSSFNIYPTGIHPDIEWNRINRNNYYAKVNVSDWDVEVRDVKIILNNLLYFSNTPASFVKSFSVQYWDGTAISYSTKIKVEDIQFNGDSVPHVVIYIENVNTTLDEVFNVTIELTDFENRSTVALEGIESKTGSFAFSIDADSDAQSPGTIDFSLSALLEISDKDKIEGFFSCYIEGLKALTEIQFLNAINKTSAYTDSKTLTIPSNVEDGVYVVHCDLGFIGFGNDKDTATDTFTILSQSSRSSPFIVAIIEAIDDVIEKIFGVEEAEDGISKIIKDNTFLFTVLLSVIIGLIFLFIFFWFIFPLLVKRRKD